MPANQAALQGGATPDGMEVEVQQKQCKPAPQAEYSRSFCVTFVLELEGFDLRPQICQPTGSMVQR